MNKKVISIMFLMILTSVINNLAHPVTPELVNSIGYGAFFLGTLFASMSLANFLMSPVWGKLSDRYGRKPFLIMAPIGYGIAQLGFGFSTYPLLIIFFRLVAGAVSCASFVCGMAYLIDVSQVSKRTKIMALYSAITGFSATLGYLIGGFIGDKNYQHTFLFQGIVSILSSFLILVLIKEVKPKAKIAQKGSVIKDLSKYRGTLVPYLLLITLLTSFMHIGFNNSFNSYMKFVLNLGPKYIGFVMAITGFIGLLMNIIIFPFIRRRFNDYYSLILCIFKLALSLFFAMYFASINFTITMLILIIFFAFLALYKPLLQSILSQQSTASGEIMGLNNGFTALGNVGGSFYAGWMFENSVNLTFYSLSFISFCSFILLMTKKKDFS